MKTTKDVTRPYSKIRHLKRQSEKGFYKCVECKKEIGMGEEYFGIGLRARTLHERQYSKLGCIWYWYCKECA